MEKIREYRESTTSVASSQGIGDDALSKVLGLERCGRVRGLGYSVTPSKVGTVSENKAHVIQLEEEVGTLKEQMMRQNEQMTRQNEQIARQNKIFVQQNELIKKLVVAVQVQQGRSIVDLSTSIPDVSALSIDMMHLSRRIDVSKVQRVETTQYILEPRRTSNLSHSSSPPQVQSVETTDHTLEPRKTSNHSQSSSPSQGRGNALGRKCKLMNWSVAEELVAIGRWDTYEPNTMVYYTRLGENASRVWVDDVINGCAPLWRIYSYMETMADAKGTTIA